MTPDNVQFRCLAHYSARQSRLEPSHKSSVSMLSPATALPRVRLLSTFELFASFFAFPLFRAGSFGSFPLIRSFSLFSFGSF
ncbi:hypothetical protein BDV41DRAFT_542086 [Aspergillus transmontanensis]|uniref:Uncharacterized protein n=1 Tax=Aspergillus transmontanensis TaxID=1034304 RepID=A0A5N6VW79_9EURO|nr:hypothetical protein BDV41DRAFT_542086 [Aspergillus transmontanensis]